MSDVPLDAPVQSDLKIKWYRTKLEAAVLRQMTARSDAKGLAQALGHLLLYLATGALTFWSWSAQVWVGFAVALWCHGAVASFMHGTATHELGHGTVFRTKWPNRFFLSLFSLLGWWNHVDYAVSHTYHHRFTLYPEADRENVLPLSPVPGFLMLLQLCTVNLFVPAGRTFGSGGFFALLLHNLRLALGLRPRSKAPSIRWVDALHRDQPAEARRSVRWARITVLFHAAVIAAGTASGLWVLPIIITLGPFIANIVRFSVGIAQHSGMRLRDPDFRKVARSMRLGPVLTFLYWRMNWHCEHHMYAAVPFYNLPKLAKHIAWDLPVPKGLVGTWKQMLEIRRRQEEDPSYEFDMPLPATATAVSAAGGAAASEPSEAGPEKKDDDLSSSIGDLAPTGLE